MHNYLQTKITDLSKNISQILLGNPTNNFQTINNENFENPAYLSSFWHFFNKENCEENDIDMEKKIQLKINQLNNKINLVNNFKAELLKNYNYLQKKSTGNNLEEEDNIIEDEIKSSLNAKALKNINLNNKISVKKESLINMLISTKKNVQNEEKIRYIEEINKLLNTVENLKKKYNNDVEENSFLKKSDKITEIITKINEIERNENLTRKIVPNKISLLNSKDSGFIIKNNKLIIN